MYKSFFAYSILLLVTVACDRSVTIDNVDVLEKITHGNGFYEYQYLTVPDSASEDQLLALSKQIRERDERSFKETVYHYYLSDNPEKRIAIIHGFHGGRPARDTLEVIQHPRRTDVDFNSALKEMQEFKDSKQFVVSDSCFGVWRNWANPFKFYLILYKKQNKYFVQTFAPGSFGIQTDTLTLGETVLGHKALVMEKQEYLHFEPRAEKNTYRYVLNEFGDITWMDQYGKASEYVQAVYSYICGCDHQQDIEELKD